MARVNKAVLNRLANAEREQKMEQERIEKKEHMRRLMAEVPLFIKYLITIPLLNS